MTLKAQVKTLTALPEQKEEVMTIVEYSLVEENTTDLIIIAILTVLVEEVIDHQEPIVIMATVEMSSLNVRAIQEQSIEMME
jgi:hypothetical protein